MYRMVYEKLMKWKTSAKRKPLILRGVRQCGKTYALRRFGEENYQSVAYFNFEKNSGLASIFEHDLDPKRIVEELEVEVRFRIGTDTLIIFDEIQFCGPALTSLKYFQEDAPEYHIVCAGSLLGVMLSKPLSFPVGKVDFLTMRPMCFPEFLIASGESKLYEWIKDKDTDAQMSKIFLNDLNRLYREYCFVGGMPEAVESWITSRDPDEVREVHERILTSYEADFAKHAPSKDMQKLNMIWNSIPSQLSKENRKFVFGHAVEGGRARELEDALQWLIDAGMVHKVRMIEKPHIPLSAYSTNTFKLYYADVGLLSTMTKVPASSIMSRDERYTEFKGGLTENYVLTELLACTDSTPFYWRSGNRAEVDFVHMIADEIVPIEVKSGKVSRMQSLERYIEQFDPKVAFVISERDIQAGKVTFLPLSLVWKINEYV